MKKILGVLCSVMLLAGSIYADKGVRTEPLREEIILEEEFCDTNVAVDETKVGETSDVVGAEAPVSLDEVEELRFRIPYEMASITCDGECLYVTVRLNKQHGEEELAIKEVEIHELEGEMCYCCDGCECCDDCEYTNCKCDDCDCAKLVS